jgi:hypothetical protein
MGATGVRAFVHHFRKELCGLEQSTVKIDNAYFTRLLTGEIDGPILDLGQLAAFWCVRARVSRRGELEGLSPTEATVQLLLVYIGEVGNGGHVQYFLNSSGDLSHETIKALTELNETELADALRAAVGCFPGGYVPKERAAREAALGRFSEVCLSRLSDLDSDVWALKRDVHDRALTFLRRHSEDVLQAERD